jgi:hypothetical protein
MQTIGHIKELRHIIPIYNNIQIFTSYLNFVFEILGLGGFLKFKIQLTRPINSYNYYFCKALTIILNKILNP